MSLDYTVVAGRVIARLRAMYPSFSRMLQQDKEILALMVDEWSKSLSGMEIEKIDLALEKVRRSGADFPPSLPKFVEYCGGRVKPWWETMEGIEHKADELGIARNPRQDLLRLEVLQKARELGEKIPLGSDERKTEALPDGVKQLAQGMKQ